MGDCRRRGQSDRVPADVCAPSAEVRQLPDNSWLLIENHCPICSAAKNCPRFCESELELFEKLLGDQVEIKRTEYLLEGNRRCAYKISKIETEETA